ncbi:MAG: hypothetical protein ABJA67_12785 [Chthonomonadales bacterium]
MATREYFVYGTDEAWYGPVDLPTMAQWVGQGRIVRNTPVTVPGSELVFRAENISALNFTGVTGGLPFGLDFDAVASPENVVRLETSHTAVEPEDTSNFVEGSAIGFACAVFVCVGWLVLPPVWIYHSVLNHNRFCRGLVAGFLCGIYFWYLLGTSFHWWLHGFPAM